MSPFCEPVTVTSTPHSSWRKSMDASEDTVSTMKSAGWPAASMAARMSGRLVVTPVEVSLCTTITARMRPSVSRRSLSSTSWGSTPGAPVARHQVHVEPEAAGHLRPLAGEEAAVEGENPIPGGKRVHQRRLPRAGGRGGEDEDGAVGLEDRLQLFEHAQGEFRELRTAVVDDRPVHGAPDPLRYVGGAGELEKVPAAACDHAPLG